MVTNGDCGSDDHDYHEDNDCDDHDDHDDHDDNDDRNDQVLHDVVDDDDSRWCPGSVILLLVLSWTRIPSSTVIIITVITLDGHEHG